MSALKPCPFCEGEGSLERVTWGRPYVACAGCGASAWGDTPQSAITAWNRRAGDDDNTALRAELEAVKGALAEVRKALGDTP